MQINEALSSEEQEILKGYLSVLRGKEEINCFYSVNDMGEKYMQKGHRYYNYSGIKSMTIEEGVYSIVGEQYRRDWLEEIAFMDMDGDGEREMVICGMSSNYIFVLHRENDRVYGIDISNRDFNIILKNGIHTKYGGIGHTVYYSIFFENSMFIEKELAGIDYSDYFIGTQQVTQEEYEQWQEMESVNWNNSSMMKMWNLIWDFWNFPHIYGWDGTIYYAARNVEKSGYQNCYYTDGFFFLKDGVIRNEAVRLSYYDGNLPEGEQYVYYRYEQEETVIDQREWEQLYSDYTADMTERKVSFAWFQLEEDESVSPEELLRLLVTSYKDGIY